MVISGAIGGTRHHPVFDDDPPLPLPSNVEVYHSEGMTIRNKTKSIGGAFVSMITIDYYLLPYNLTVFVSV